MSQELLNKITTLEAQLNQANASGQAAHQTLMEALSNFLSARTENIVLIDKSQTMQTQMNSRLIASQKTIDELQKQVVALTAEIADWKAKIPAPEGRVIEGETASANLHLA